MKEIIREIYGAGIMFFYFLKWPILIGLPWLYSNGLNRNYILDALWLYCLFLVFKDFYMLLKKRKEKPKDEESK